MLYPVGNDRHFDFRKYACAHYNNGHAWDTMSTDRVPVAQNMTVQTPNVAPTTPRSQQIESGDANSIVSSDMSEKKNICQNR